MPSEDEEEFRDTEEELGKTISCPPEIINLDPEPRQSLLSHQSNSLFGSF